jgi:hypothetical protein
VPRPTHCRLTIVHSGSTCNTRLGSAHTVQRAPTASSASCAAPPPDSRQDQQNTSHPEQPTNQINKPKQNRQQTNKQTNQPNTARPPAGTGAGRAGRGTCSRRRCRCDGVNRVRHRESWAGQSAASAVVAPRAGSGIPYRRGSAYRVGIPYLPIRFDGHRVCLKRWPPPRAVSPQQSAAGVALPSVRRE